MIGWLKCALGWHDWRIAKEIDVEGTGFTDAPMDFEPGGVDYVIQCARCPHFYVDQRRAFWIAPGYPPLTADKGTVGDPLAQDKRDGGPR